MSKKIKIKWIVLHAIRLLKNHILFKRKVKHEFGEKKILSDKSVVLISIIDKKIHDITSYFRYYESIGVQSFVLICQGELHKEITKVTDPSKHLVYSFTPENSDDNIKIINHIAFLYRNSKWTIINRNLPLLVYTYNNTRKINDLVEYLDSTRELSASCVDINYETLSCINNKISPNRSNPFIRLYSKKYGVNLISLTSSLNDQTKNKTINLCNISIIKWKWNFYFKDDFSLISPKRLENGIAEKKIFAANIYPPYQNNETHEKELNSLVEWEKLYSLGIINNGEWSK